MSPCTRRSVSWEGLDLWVKAEGLQPIGSFKLRGAFNKIVQLSAGEQARGVITYSSGNHAQGVSYAARALGIKAVIVMPSNAPLVKVNATRALGAEIVTVGPASAERKAKAEELAATFGYVVIPPYDDRDIIAGQGTCGLEILADRPAGRLGARAGGRRRAAERCCGCVEAEQAGGASDRSRAGTCLRCC